MKKIFIIIAFTMVFSSCEEFLTEYPKTEMTAETSFEQYDAVLKSVSFLYAKLGKKGSGLFGPDRFRMPSPFRTSFAEFNWNQTSDFVTRIWDDYYAYIAQANIIITGIENNKEAIDESFLTAELENFEFKSKLLEDEGFSAADMLLGEAKFMRAYAYFTLYRFYGAVPLVTEQTSPKPQGVKRASRQEIFDFLNDELDFARQHCALNNSGISYGRISAGAAAGMLAKVKVFQASYIRRAEMYGGQLMEETGGDRTELYTAAKELCEDIITGNYGEYKLTSYYPAVFTESNSEIMFSILAEEGTETGNEIPMGFEGYSEHGANRGYTVTPWYPIILDVPTWEHGSRFKQISTDFGERDVFQTIEVPTPVDSLIDLYASLQKYSLTGDTTRRFWSTAKGTATGPKDGSLEAGLWIFEAMGSTLGPDYYITPGKKFAYDPVEKRLIDRLLQPHERPWWRNSTPDDRDTWRVKRFCLGKFRNLNPQDLDPAFKIDISGVDYPILRYAEIFLLLAEAQHFLGNDVEAINNLNVLRDRACNQSTMKDMYDYQGKANYTYIPNSVMKLPTGLPSEQVFREIMFERIRELMGEDDCAWFDCTRYPDHFIEQADDVCRYREPYQGRSFFSDWNRGVFIFDYFNASDVHYVLLPIPATELTFFPELRQNPGY